MNLGFIPYCLIFMLYTTTLQINKHKDHCSDQAEHLDNVSDSCLLCSGLLCSGHKTGICANENELKCFYSHVVALHRRLHISSPSTLLKVLGTHLSFCYMGHGSHTLVASQ